MLKVILLVAGTVVYALGYLLFFGLGMTKQEPGKFPWSPLLFAIPWPLYVLLIYLGQLYDWLAGN